MAMQSISKGTIGSPVLWGDQVDKLNANFTELYAAGSVNPVYVNIHDYGVVADGSLHSGNEAAFAAAVTAAKAIATDPNGRSVPVCLVGMGTLLVDFQLEPSYVSMDFRNLTIVPVNPWSVSTIGSYVMQITHTSSVPQGYFAYLRFHQNHLIVDQATQPDDFTCVHIEDFNCPGADITIVGDYFSTLCTVAEDSEKLSVKLHGMRGWRMLHESASSASPDTNEFWLHATEVGLIHQQSGSHQEISGIYHYAFENPWAMDDQGGGTATHGHPAGAHVQLTTKKQWVGDGAMRAGNDPAGVIEIDDPGTYGGNYVFNGLAMIGNSNGPALTAVTAQTIRGTLHLYDNKYTGEGVILGNVLDYSGFTVESWRNRHNPALRLGDATYGNPTEGHSMMLNHRVDPGYGGVAVQFDNALDNTTVLTRYMGGTVDFGSATGNRVVGTRSGATVSSGTGEIYDETGSLVT